jgi:hypothetical protein
MAHDKAKVTFNKHIKGIAFFTVSIIVDVEILYRELWQCSDDFSI